MVCKGKAVKQSNNGECEERSYENGRLSGQAIVISQDGSKEIRNYQVHKDTFFIKTQDVMVTFRTTL